MSTPIETNTEELQEILQTVYNLPMAGGGSSEPDLVIYGVPIASTGDYFNFVSGSYTGGVYGPQYITFDQEQVTAAYEKLISGKDVRAVFYLPSVTLNSWDGAWAVRYPAVRVIATHNDTPRRLAVRFDCASEFHSGYGITYKIEYVFGVDTTNRTATLQSWIIHKLNTNQV